MTIRELINNSGELSAQAVLSFIQFWQDAFEKTSSRNYLDLTILQAIVLLLMTLSIIYLYYYVARISSLDARYWRVSVKPYVSPVRYYSRLIFLPLFPCFMAWFLLMQSALWYWAPLLGIDPLFAENFGVISVGMYISLYLWWITLSTKEPFPIENHEWDRLIGPDYIHRASIRDKEIDFYLEKRTIPELSQDKIQIYLNSCARVYERRSCFYFTEDIKEKNLKSIFDYPDWKFDLIGENIEDTENRKLETMEKLRQKKYSWDF